MGGKIKTKDRILQTSLALFNAHGEPNVTTLQIADELNMSPGNLYYHFKNKGEILNEIFDRFDQEITDLLDVPEARITIEQHWVYLHLAFECIARFRFLYQDLVNLLSRYTSIEPRFRRILRRKHQASIKIFSSLREQGIMAVDDAEIACLADSISLTMTYWLSFSAARSGRPPTEEDLVKGIRQVMSLVAPYLDLENRKLLMAMSESYL